MVIGITGARSLNATQLSTVQEIAQQAAHAGSVYTGCALGADAAAVAGARAASSALRIFAVGAPDGTGFPRGYVPRHVETLGAQPGVCVSWLAGGPLSVPLVARLARRSLAMLRAVAVAGGALVAFPAASAPPRAFGSGPFPSCGSGTWSTIAAAVLLNLPVFVVFPSVPLAAQAVGGYWSASSLFGCAGWWYVPAQGLF